MLGEREQLFELAPDSFARKVREINRAANLYSRGVDGHLKSRRELYRAQYAQAVLDECIGSYGPQHPALQVCAAAIWIAGLAR